MPKKEMKCCDECPCSGDVFTCDCGMTVVVLKDCQCGDPATETCIACCGKAMKKVN